MGNRVSRKVPKQLQADRGSELVTAPRYADAVQFDLNRNEAPTRQDEAPLGEGDTYSSRQAPPTARNTIDKGGPLECFQRCYEVDGDPFNLYTQALLLKDQREFAAASDLLRTQLSNPSLSLEAHHHLAQCLIAQDPALNWCLNETTRCLEHVVVTIKSLTDDADANHSIMYRESLELLAHVQVANGQFDRALHLLDMMDAVNVDTNLALDQAALRHQRVLVSFQRAFCHYARGDPADVVSAELLGIVATGRGIGEEQSEALDPLDGIELLLRGEAEGLRRGLALMATSICSHF